MTLFRLISLSAHGAAELVIGVAALAAPFVFGFGDVATVVSVVAGALVVGLALTTTAPARSGERGSLSIVAHYALDRWLIVAFSLVALTLALYAERGAALFFLVAALAQLGLTTTTRYTAA